MIVCGQTVADRVGQALQPVADDHAARRSTPRFLISVSTCSQYLAPSPPSPAHSPRMSRRPSHGDRQRDVDRPVGDLPVADLHVDRVDEDHRVDRVEGPVLPLGHALDDLVGDRGDRLPGHLGAVDLGQVRRDLPGGQPLRRQRDHHLVDPGQPPLPLARRSSARSVPSRSRGHVDLDRPDLGQHRLGPVPVAGVAAVPPGRVVLVVAEVVGDLALQRGLQHPLGQLRQQPALAGQLQPARAGPARPAGRSTARPPRPARRPRPWSPASSSRSTACSGITSVIGCSLHDRSYTVVPQ